MPKLSSPDVDAMRAESALGTPDLVEALNSKHRNYPTGLSGKVVVIDEFAVEHSNENGFLTLTFYAQGAQTYREVEVHNGQWSATLPRQEGENAVESVGVGVCILGERRAAPELRDDLFAIPDDGLVDLSMRWLQDLRLHVIASDTGRELDDVILCEQPALSRRSELELQRPASDLMRTARLAGPSPVWLGTSQDQFGPRVFFARSGDYAWGRIQVDQALDSEPTLILEPAGELELLVRGDPWNQRAEIELASLEARGGGEYLDVELGESKSFVLDGLPAGRYTAEARDYGRLVGTVTAEVLAGLRATATLDLHARSTRLVPFEGVLELPAEWKMDEFFLEFWLSNRVNDQRIGDGFRIRSAETVRQEGSHGGFRWKFLAVQPGRYRVHLPWAGFSTEIDTGPEGTRAGRIVVPAPGEVYVRCVDESSMAEVESEGVSLGVLGPRVFDVWSCASLPGGQYPNPQCFRCPQGQILIFTKPNRYAAASRIVAVGPGTNEVILRLRTVANLPNPEER